MRSTAQRLRPIVARAIEDEEKVNDMKARGNYPLMLYISLASPLRGGSRLLSGKKQIAATNGFPKSPPHRKKQRCVLERTVQRHRCPSAVGSPVYTTLQTEGEWSVWKCEGQQPHVGTSARPRFDRENSGAVFGRCLIIGDDVQCG